MKKIILVCFFVISIFLINLVNAEILVSEAGVEYESRILDVLNNNTFVPIIIELNEFSDAEARDLLSMFDEENIKDIAIHNLTNSIGVDMTEDAFFELIQDERVDKVYYDIPMFTSSKKQIRRYCCSRASC